MTDSRLLESHEQAVASTVHEMESATGPLVIAAYQHRTSRTLDPLIHTHLVVGNLQQTEGGWRAVDAVFCISRKRRSRSITIAPFCSTPSRLGYRVKAGEREGVSDELYVKFSQRSGEREQATQQYKKEHGLGEETELSNRQIAALVYQHRGPKEVLPAEQIRERQIARLTPSEHRQLVTLKEQAAERQSISEKHRICLHDHVEFEPEAHRQRWSYGQPGERQKMGYG